MAGCAKPAREVSFERVKTPADLAEHSEEFRRRIEHVTDRVHVAIGYGLANSILLVGEDGVIVVDTLGTIEAAREVWNEFRKITDKPLRAIIYTHNHADHVFGARGFAPEADVPVYAHKTTARYIDRVVSVVRPIIGVRSMRMFGTYLDDAARVNAGIGLRLGIDEHHTVGVIRPTRVFEDELEDEVAGIRFRLVSAPGETNDQLFVWLPDDRVVLPGDNIYKTFPNLYTIRGTPYRDVSKWVESLDEIRALRPDYLVPSHTGPIAGAERIERTLRDYRDAIQYVHDQTIRGMNQGRTPDELAATIKLPPHLARSPYLAEFYGTVAWSVRSVFDGNLGWFDGNPTRLDPLAPLERAKRMAELAGGRDRLLAQAREAARQRDWRWVLELTDHLLQLDREDERAKKLRIAALEALGGQASNPNARHYYLTRAAELAGRIEIAPRPAKPLPEMVHEFPLENFFRAMAVNLDPVASADLDQRVGFVFPDTGEAFTIHVRRGVAEIQDRLADDLDMKATVDSKVFKEMLAELRNPAWTIAHDFDVEGGKLAFTKFMSLFRPPS
ncbi:MAG: MBL fold metallo-hydrolase [Deltaproteobacteria bacterium]|nr:MAG: MBL fold metallo-hydrolase [Deltaproteobacteria bacterium]